MGPLVVLVLFAVVTMFVAAEVSARTGTELRPVLLDALRRWSMRPSARRSERAVRLLAGELDAQAELLTVAHLQRQLYSGRLVAVVSAGDTIGGPVLSVDLGDTVVELRLYSIGELSELAAEHHGEPGALTDLHYQGGRGWCARVLVGNRSFSCLGWLLRVRRCSTT